MLSGKPAFAYRLVFSMRNQFFLSLVTFNGSLQVKLLYLFQIGPFFAVQSVMANMFAKRFHF